ncbi:MAG: sulfatase [Armatimonadota bacterium]
MSSPNVLLIVLDSVRADRLSCYGYDRPTTPNLDRLAEEGTLFEGCWSESSWTLPVCFTLLTGLAPREHQAEQYRVIPDALPTLPEAMQAGGYRTVLCSANAFIGPVTNLHRGFDRVYIAAQVKPIFKPVLKYLLARLGWTDWGGAALTARLPALLAQARQPWFGLIWYNDCHHPYLGRPPFRTRFLRRRMSLRRRFELMARMRNMEELSATMDERDREDVNDLYDGALCYNDNLLGRLRAELERRGLWDDTVVIVCADHGDMLGEHGLTSHGRPAGLYRPLLRVPLIVRAPGMVPAGRRSDALVQLADVTQTIAAIAGKTDALPDSASRRIDLREAATGAGRELAVSERAAWPEKRLPRARRQNPHFDFGPFLGHMAALVQDGWELITAETGRDELYHLAVDPEETRDLIDDEPERARLMRETLRQWQERVLPHPATEGRVEEDDPAVRKHLEGLGYF